MRCSEGASGREKLALPRPPRLPSRPPAVPPHLGCGPWRGRARERRAAPPLLAPAALSRHAEPSLPPAHGVLPSPTVPATHALLPRSGLRMRTDALACTYYCNGGFSSDLCVWCRAEVMPFCPGTGSSCRRGQELPQSRRCLAGPAGDGCWWQAVTLAGHLWVQAAVLTWHCLFLLPRDTHCPAISLSAESWWHVCCHN